MARSSDPPSSPPASDDPADEQQRAALVYVAVHEALADQLGVEAADALAAMTAAGRAWFSRAEPQRFKA